MAPKPPNTQFATNTSTGQLQFLEARHRAHARVEDRIRHARDTGLGRLPSREFALNQAWLVAVMIAADLIAWTRMLACIGEAAVLALYEPKAMRYRFLHVAALLTRSSRRRRVKIPETWPWAVAIEAVFHTIAAIPKPARSLLPAHDSTTRRHAHRQRQPELPHAYSPIRTRHP